MFSGLAGLGLKTNYLRCKVSGLGVLPDIAENQMQKNVEDGISLRYRDDLWGVVLGICRVCEVGLHCGILLRI